MIIVDDRLALDALAGTLAHDEGDAVATTWAFHFRLVRAVGSDRSGALSRDLDDEVQRLVVGPPSDRLVVLDPRETTEVAARLAGAHRLNLLAADLLGAAVVHGATVRLSSANVGREWPGIMAQEGVTLEVVDVD